MEVRISILDGHNVVDFGLFRRPTSLGAVAAVANSGEFEDFMNGPLEGPVEFDVKFETDGCSLVRRVKFTPETHDEDNGEWSEFGDWVEVAYVPLP